MSVAISFSPIVSANTINQTDGSAGNDEINGVEVWRNTHNLVGTVTVPPGAKLIINAGASITLAAGSALIVDGAICAGDTGCGATAGGTISFTWQSPADELSLIHI